MSSSLRLIPIAFVATALLASCGNKALDQYNLGIDALEHGDTSAALTHFESAARERPSDPDIHIDYGVALLRAGQPQQAVTELEAATSLAPDNAIAHLDLAEAYKATK